jgi:hypothetical protein
MAVQARRKVYDMLVARKAGKEATTTRSAPSPGGDGLKKGGCHPPGAVAVQSCNIFFFLQRLRAKMPHP